MKNKIAKIIAAWPVIWSKQLKPKLRKKISQKTIARLSQANQHLWNAYNIYDDIIDEQKNIEKLPQANIELYKFLTIYYSLKLSAGFYKYLEKLFFLLEQANLWEMSHQQLTTRRGYIIISQKKFPSNLNRRLANKSLLLVAAPLAMLFITKQATKNNITKLLSLFKKILSARQLSDDARDWLTDLQNHKLTAANILVLNEFRQLKRNLNLQANLAKAQIIFARSAGPKIARLINKFINDALVISQDLKYLNNSDFIRLATSSQARGAKRVLITEKLLKNAII